MRHALWLTAAGIGLSLALAVACDNQTVNTGGEPANDDAPAEQHAAGSA